MCSNGPLSSPPFSEEEEEDSSDVNSIDKATAFWIGTQNDTKLMIGWSLYAWSNRDYQKISSSLPSSFVLMMRL